MRIAVLTKRQYMSKDLLSDRYGRFYEIPKALLKLGHEVIGLALSYRHRPEIGARRALDIMTQGDVPWASVNLGSNPIAGLRRYFRFIDQWIADFKPDLVWSCSDAFHVLFGLRIKRRHGIPVVVDLYDNFAAYPATHYCGVYLPYRKALDQVDGVTVVSHSLADLLERHYGVGVPIQVITNAIDQRLFHPRNRLRCREALDIPPDAKVLGTVGALTPDRDIGLLYAAYDKLTRRGVSAYLVIAGPRPRLAPPPQAPRIRDLGLVPYQRVPEILGAMDLGIVSNKPSRFATYCFPQKFHEMVAMDLPVLAAAVGDLRVLLKNHPQCLYAPRSLDALVTGIIGQFTTPTPPRLPVPTWALQAQRLSLFFERVISSQGTR